MADSDFEIDGFRVSEDMLPEVDQLPESLQIIAEIVGVRNALEVGKRFQGTVVAFTMLTKIRRKIRNSAIINDFDNGMSASKLSLKYGLTERQIYSILNQSV